MQSTLNPKDASQRQSRLREPVTRISTAKMELQSYQPSLHVPRHVIHYSSEARSSQLTSQNTLVSLQKCRRAVLKLTVRTKTNRGVSTNLAQLGH